MNQLNALHRINELLVLFVLQVKGPSSSGLYDINIVAEQVLIPIFNECYDYHLRNLNREQANYPGIDLADDDQRVAFQITATPDSKKIKDTLTQFTDCQHYTRYDRLIVYILTEKQDSYSGKGFEAIIRDRFHFDKNQDILDYRDLFQQISSLPFDKIQRIEALLGSQFGQNQTLFPKPTHPQARTEPLYSNLLEISFPQTLFIGELVRLDRLQIIADSQKSAKPLRLHPSNRDLIFAALHQRGLRFSADWVDYEGCIITFHDPRDEELPLSKIIKKGKVEELETARFYSKNENTERVFKRLLFHCFSRKIYDKHIGWNHQDRLFVFLPNEAKQPARKEYWYSGKRQVERMVFERKMKKKKPDEILHYKHFAFQANFKQYEQQWYVAITPDWFFSKDGKEASLYGFKSVQYLKRKERNQQVFNHLKFIVYILKSEPLAGLYTKHYTYPFLSFGKLHRFDAALMPRQSCPKRIGCLMKIRRTWRA